MKWNPDGVRSDLLEEIKQIQKMREEQNIELFEGKKLKPKEHMNASDDSIAEVIEHDPDKGWWIVIDGKFGHRYETVKDIIKDFDEVD